eukprot:TRINITY_DN613_c0_g2_i1.p1 TRINITY_DN613_c0_g2~~TRINITY_DN613_c0_g2_i1.p1  ORF type:complete len:284 (-),score=53.77 TRINITY_DN613_c0_g2_i1:475-1326(-)
MSVSLLQFGDGPSRWREALASYTSRLEGKANEKLTKLNAFYTEELPSIIQKRGDEPFVTKEEVKKIVEWKLSRGKFRPTLMKFASELDEEAVKAASTRSFAAMPDLKKAIAEMTKLKGVGPATASAILAAYDPMAPFMSDEAYDVSVGGSNSYSLKQYLTFAEKIKAKAAELTSKSKEEGGSAGAFTPSDVERALWASRVPISVSSTPTSPPKQGKRRAKDITKPPQNPKKEEEIVPKQPVAKKPKLTGKARKTATTAATTTTSTSAKSEKPATRARASKRKA